MILASSCKPFANLVSKLDTYLWVAAFQVLRIVTLGAGSNDDKSKSKGGFFPEGVNGNINSTAGFQNAVNAKAGYPGNKVCHVQTGSFQIKLILQSS